MCYLQLLDKQLTGSRNGAHMCYFQMLEKGRADAGHLRSVEVTRWQPAANDLVVCNHQAVVPLNNRSVHHTVLIQERCKRACCKCVNVRTFTTTQTQSENLSKLTGFSYCSALKS